MTGSVLTAVLALAIDYIAGLVEEWLTPRGLD
jgi:ABC-type proline/glycine betaine transport system permease subunit